MPTIADNYQTIRRQLAQWQATDTTIIAVAKTFPAAAVRAAAAAGVTDIGENYLQEAEEKIAACADLALVWHFIGAVQKNKTARIARLFNWVHGVDRASVAARLSAAREGMPPLSVCLQVNISNEKAKAGVTAANATALAQDIAAMPNLRLRGLMAIPAEEKDEDKQFAVFRQVSALQHELRQNVNDEQGLLDVLSMGMSGDYRQAVRAGATHIRLGSAIFGKREKKEKKQ